MDDRFKPEIIEDYKGLDRHIRDEYPTIVSAINAGLITPVDEIYHDVFLLVDTGVPRFTRFPVTLSGNWYGDLTTLIAARAGRNKIDVVYLGTPINILPVEELIDLSHTRTRFQIMDAKVTLETRPTPSSSSMTAEPATKTLSPDELTLALREDFIRYVKRHPESEENMLSIVQILRDGNTALNFISDWIKTGIELPEASMNVLAEILKTVDPTPAVTPIVNAFAEAVRSAAINTTDSISGAPASNVVVKAFTDLFDPTPVVKAINGILGLDASVSVKVEAHRQHHHKGPRYGTSHLKKPWVYDKDKYDHVTIGEAYSMDVQALKTSLQLDVGHRLFRGKYSGDDHQSLMKNNETVTSDEFIQVEISAMRSKNKRLYSKVKNAALGRKKHVLVALFAVGGRGRTYYTNCYHVEMVTRQKDVRTTTTWFKCPAIKDLTTFRVVVWNERGTITGKTSWGSIVGKTGTIPSPAQTFDVKVTPISPTHTYDDHPRINLEMNLLEKMNNLSVEAIEGKVHTFMNIYVTQMSGHQFPAPSSSVNPDDLDGETNKGQLLSSDTEITLPDAADYIKEVRQNWDGITDRQVLYLLRVLEAILNPNSNTYLPLYVGPVHDSLGRNREAQQFVKKGLDTLGTDFFGVDNDCIHIFGRNRIYLAFKAFLTMPHETIVAAIKKRYPEFNINENDIVKHLPHLADYTGDHLPIDKDDYVSSGSIWGMALDTLVTSSDIFGTIVHAVAGTAKLVRDNAAPAFDAAMNGMVDTGIEAVKGVVGLGVAAVEATTEAPFTAASLIPSVEDAGDDIYASVSITTTTGSQQQQSRLVEDQKLASRKQRSVVSRVTSKKNPQHSSFNPAPNPTLFTDSFKPPLPSPSSSSAEPIGAVLADGGITTHGDVIRLNIMDEFKNFQDSVPEEKLPEFYKVMQVLMSYEHIVDFYRLISPYKNLTDLVELDDLDLKFAPKSGNRLAYKAGSLYIVLKTNETLEGFFWPRIIGKDSILETACALAATTKVDLIPLEKVLLRIVGHDTDFTNASVSSIGEPLSRVTLQLPNENVQHIDIPSPETTLSDINALAGNMYDQFQVVVSSKHHAKHGKAYWMKHHGQFVACKLYDELPDEYKTGSMVLKAYESPYARGFTLLDKATPDLIARKRGVIYMSPTKAEITQALGTRFSLGDFVKTFVLPIRKRRDGTYRPQGFKDDYIISKDFTTITIKGEEFALQTKSTDPLIYTILK